MSYFIEFMSHFRADRDDIARCEWNGGWGHWCGGVRKSSKVIDRGWKGRYHYKFKLRYGE